MRAAWLTRTRVELGGREEAVLGRGWVVVKDRFLSRPPAVLCQAAAFIVVGREVAIMLIFFLMLVLLVLLILTGLDFFCQCGVEEVYFV